MKKIFLIIAILAMPFAASAQGFRGFIDIFGGTQFGGGIDFPTYDVTNVKNDLAFGLNVTGGYQITNYLFAGIGFGGYAALIGATSHDDYYSDRNRDAIPLHFPFYADVRWTLDIDRKITPFVDVKIGYQIVHNVDDGGIAYYRYNGELDYRYNDELYAKGKNGVYFMPSVGVRFGKASGFNFGIAYNACVGTKFLQNYEVSPDNYELREVAKTNKGVFMITFGADF